MTREQTALTTTGIALVVALLFAVLCVCLKLPGPTAELNQWTEWVGKVVGILVAARVFWAGANFVERKAGIQLN